MVVLNEKYELKVVVNNGVIVLYCSRSQATALGAKLVELGSLPSTLLLEGELLENAPVAIKPDGKSRRLEAINL